MRVESGSVEQEEVKGILVLPAEEAPGQVMIYESAPSARSFHPLF